MAQGINPISKAFISFYNEIKKYTNVEKLKPADLDALDSSMAQLPSKWNILALKERARILRDANYFSEDMMGRIQIIKSTAKNGFQDILDALKHDRHNLLINPVLIEAIIDNPELTFGEKREQVVQAFTGEIQTLSEDPYIKNRLQNIDPQYRRDLLQIKEDFKKEKSPEEKVQVLQRLKEVSKPLKQKMDELREKLKPEEAKEPNAEPNDAAIEVKTTMENHTDLCLVGMDDPEFIHALLFEVPYKSFPSSPIRLAFLSLFSQRDGEKTEMNPSYSKVEASIKTYDFKAVPAHLRKWNELVKENTDPALRSLTPSLKNLAERLTKHTNITIDEYFKAVFSAKKRAEIEKKKELAKYIPQINQLREILKSRTTDRPHLKNVKRNCLEIEKNQNLPALRLKYRKELGIDIPMTKMDEALSKLNEGSLEGVKSIIKEFGIKNEGALLKLLAIRVAHYPIIAAKLALYSEEKNPELKNFLKNLQDARSEVLRTLMSYE